MRATTTTTTRPTRARRAGTTVAIGVAFGLTALGCTNPGTPTYYYPDTDTEFDMDCETSTSGDVDYTEITEGVTVTAPLAADPGAQFIIEYQIDPLTTPAAQTSRVGHWQYRFPVPENSTFVTAILVPGSGYSGTPSVALNGSNVQFDLLTWQTANTEIVFPTILVTLQATGPRNSVMTTTMGGTSYGNWGLKYKTEETVLSTPIITTFTCLPIDPPPLFSLTRIR